MGYTNLPKPTTPPDIITVLNRAVEKSLNESDVFDELKQKFSEQTPAMQKQMIDLEMQNLCTALAMLRCFGLKLEDIAALFTTPEIIKP